MSDWTIDPGTMKGVAWVLQTQGAALIRDAPRVGSSITRSGSIGPFFQHVDGEVQKIAAVLDQAGTGFQSIANQLVEDADREIDQREFERMLREAQTPFGADALKPPWER